MSVTQKDLKKFFNNLLTPYLFKDYGPNGLQIEGKKEIKKIAFAVTASKEAIEKAVEFEADAIVVHHGLIWGFHGAQPLTGPFAKRVFPIVKNDINLFGYHLPLDANMEVGNAKTIATLLDMTDLEPFGDYKGTPTGVHGKLKATVSAKDLKKELKKILNHSITLASPDEKEEIGSLGIVTGGASSGWRDAAKLRLDAYLTGEISEHDWYDAKEAGVHFFAGGHNATEEFGVKELMKKVEGQFDVTCTFIPSDNPV